MKVVPILPICLTHEHCKNICSSVRKYIDLDVEDPGGGAHPGQQRGAPAGRPPGQAVAQLVQAAERDAGALNLVICRKYILYYFVFRTLEFYQFIHLGCDAVAVVHDGDGLDQHSAQLNSDTGSASGEIMVRYLLNCCNLFTTLTLETSFAAAVENTIHTSATGGGEKNAQS